MAVEEKKDLEEQLSKTFVIPEGKELANARVLCEHHGDITDSAFFFSYQTKTKEGKTVSHNNVFCIPCISEYLEKLQTNGELGKIVIQPILRDIAKAEESTDAAKADEPVDESTETEEKAAE